jgi:predicted Rossmann fold nucleotide-binding protein DprA/Smf involved in DNA uptake
VHAELITEAITPVCMIIIGLNADYTSMAAAKIVVAAVGTRTWKNPTVIQAELDRTDAELGIGTLVSGGATGPDTIAAQWAASRGIKVIICKPDWLLHGKRAGAVRNREIVNIADRVIAFWNGESSGTRITIDLATRAKKPVTVILEEGKPASRLAATVVAVGRKHSKPAELLHVECGGASAAKRAAACCFAARSAPRCKSISILNVQPQPVW